MAQTQDILLLTDGPGGAVGADLDILYPGRVRRMNFTAEPHGLRQLRPYAHVITTVDVGRQPAQTRLGGYNSPRQGRGPGHLLPL